MKIASIYSVVVSLAIAGTVACAGTAYARDQALRSADFAERARDVGVGHSFRVGDVPVAGSLSGIPADSFSDTTAEPEAGTLVLRRIEVFRPGASIVVRRGGRKVALERPDIAYFAGGLEGRPGSFAFLSVDGQWNTRGLVSDGRLLWNVGTANGAPVVQPIDPGQPPEEAAAAWGCESEGALQPPGAPALGAAAVAEQVLRAAAADAGALYQADVAVETDAEFHDLFDSTEEAVAYVGDLFAAMSAIYERDVGTALRVSHLSLWADGSSSDPWTATSTMGGLNEFMAEWRSSQTGISRTVAHFMSGKRTGGGVAYVGVLCSSYYGFGFTGSLNGRFSTTTPYLFWDILGLSHELGHNFGSGHTHCYSPPVDQCYGAQSGCYSGSASVPSDGGTIMSYCHLRSGGYSNINLWFGREGQYGNDSLRVPDLMRTRVQSAGCMQVVHDPPTVLLQAVPSTIVAGQSSTLSWTSTDADTCAFVSGSNAVVETSGSMPVDPTGTEVYEIECTGPGGTTSAEAEVTVLRPQATLEIDGSVLRVVGPTSAPSRLSIRHRETSDGPEIEVVDRKTEIQVVDGSPCVESRARFRCDATGITLIEVWTGDERDRVTVRGPIPAYVDAGGGHDVVRGGDAADILIGGAGRDRLLGRRGDDTLQGGDDADRLDGGPDDDQLQGGLGPDVLIGRGGTDTAVYVGRSTPVSATMDDVANDGEVGEGDNIRSSVELVD